MNKQKLLELRMELKEISSDLMLEEYITDDSQKEETFDNNIDISFSEDYLELFIQYVDLYKYQLQEQLPVKIIEQLIGQIKQSPTEYHNYMILKILEINFQQDQYNFIIHNLSLGQKLIRLCLKLENKKIYVVTFQLIKIILPIIYQIPAHQIKFHDIIEDLFQQLSQNELNSAQLRFLDLVFSNIQYFTKFHIEILVDWCFFIQFKQYQEQNKQNFNKLKQQALAVLEEIRFRHTQFQKNEKYFREIYHKLSSNDPIIIEICLQFLVNQQFNKRECTLIVDEQILEIFLNCLYQQSSINILIIQLFTKSLLSKRFYVPMILINEKFSQLLLHNFEVYITSGRTFEIIAYVRYLIQQLSLIEILFQENSKQAYNQYCPKILQLFINCLELKDQKILLFFIDFIYNLLNNVPHNNIMPHKMIFRKLITLLDQSKSIISPEVSIDDDPQLTILRIWDLDITKQIFRKTFTERWLSCL